MASGKRRAVLGYNGSGYSASIGSGRYSGSGGEWSGCGVLGCNSLWRKRAKPGGTYPYSIERCGQGRLSSNHYPNPAQTLRLGRECISTTSRFRSGIRSGQSPWISQNRGRPWHSRPYCPWGCSRSACGPCGTQTCKDPSTRTITRPTVSINFTTRSAFGRAGRHCPFLSGTALSARPGIARIDFTETISSAGYGHATRSPFSGSRER